MPLARCGSRGARPGVITDPDVLWASFKLTAVWTVRLDTLITQLNTF